MHDSRRKVRAPERYVYYMQPDAACPWVLEHGEYCYL